MQAARQLRRGTGFRLRRVFRPVIRALRLIDFGAPDSSDPGITRDKPSASRSRFPPLFRFESAVPFRYQGTTALRRARRGGAPPAQAKTGTSGIAWAWPDGYRNRPRAGMDTAAAAACATAAACACDKRTLPRIAPPSCRRIRRREAGRPRSDRQSPGCRSTSCSPECSGSGVRAQAFRPAYTRRSSRAVAGLVLTGVGQAFLTRLYLATAVVAARSRPRSH